ncbi:hypothetical protein [Laspinema olomoucense]|nr:MULTISPECIES: hypothetical protein [unclassified Laspinema]
MSLGKVRWRSRVGLPGEAIASGAGERSPRTIPLHLAYGPT